MNILNIPVQVASEELMNLLESKGCIIRLYPSRHRMENPVDGGEGKVLYESSTISGSHKLVAVSISRSNFNAFGTHNDNEEFLLIGGEDENKLYLLIALMTEDELQKKIINNTLSENDFICMLCKFNDANLSFFTMLKNIPHGEAVDDIGLKASSFYVTEGSNITLTKTDLKDYKIKLITEKQHGQ